MKTTTLVILVLVVIMSKNLHQWKKHAWPAGTCLTVGEPILTGVDKKQLLKNNQVAKI